MKKNKVSLTVRLDKILKLRLKTYAAKNNLKISPLVEGVLWRLVCEPRSTRATAGLENK